MHLHQLTQGSLLASVEALRAKFWFALQLPRAKFLPVEFVSKPVFPDNGLHGKRTVPTLWRRVQNWE